MPLLYDIGTGLYHAGIRAASAFNPKARAWVQGRKGLRDRLEGRRQHLKGCLWMHCASVGEFEQGLPVLEAIKRERPEVPVLVTFFSPSGYHARKGHPIATHVDFLPPDSASNARWLVAMLQPRAAIFVRYEFWHHYLAALQCSRVPSFLLSGIFRPQHPHFRWYGGIWRAMLKHFTQLFVQDTWSQELLAVIGVNNVTVSGDTRFDRVTAIVNAGEDLPAAAAFRGKGPVLVCGSTWPNDEALLLEALQSLDLPVKCVVAPHEISEAGSSVIDQRFPKPLLRWSDLGGPPATNIASVPGPELCGTLLVDHMGLLSRLYRYGDIAYVGGGFGDGIHSLLEPAAWGVPVIFGPRHQKFAEARGLIDAGAGFAIGDAHELGTTLQRLLHDPEALREAGLAATRFVQEHQGATQRVLPHLLKCL